MANWYHFGKAMSICHLSDHILSVLTLVTPLHPFVSMIKFVL